MAALRSTPSGPLPARDPSRRRRASVLPVLAVLAVLTSGLTGCGEPDDGDGGGTGYVTAAASAS